MFPFIAERWSEFFCVCLLLCQRRSETIFSCFPASQVAVMGGGSRRVLAEIVSIDSDSRGATRAGRDCWTHPPRAERGKMRKLLLAHIIGFDDGGELCFAHSCFDDRARWVLCSANFHLNLFVSNKTLPEWSAPI